MLLSQYVDTRCLNQTFDEDSSKTSKALLDVLLQTEKTKFEAFLVKACKTNNTSNNSLILNGKERN